VGEANQARGGVGKLQQPGRPLHVDLAQLGLGGIEAQPGGGMYHVRHPAGQVPVDRLVQP
jgi:hypothetical protein